MVDMVVTGTGRKKLNIMCLIMMVTKFFQNLFFSFYN
jgi:hypothetical protein